MKAFCRLTALYFLTALVMGCGGGKEPYNPSASVAGLPPTFAISPVSPASVTWGGTVAMPVTIKQIARGKAGGVSLAVSGLPAGATGAFSPTSVQPTVSGGISTLTVTTDGTATVPASPVTLTIRGSDGNDTREVTTTLTIISPPRTFALAAIPAQTVFAGDTAQFAVVIQDVPRARPTRPVTLSVSGLPPLATASFSPNPVNPTVAGATSTLSIATNPGTSSVGIYTLTVSGTDGQETITRQTTLTINAAPEWDIMPVPSQTVVTGAKATFPITLTEFFDPTAGREFHVTMSVSGLPAGMSGTFTPNPATPVAAGAPVSLTVDTAVGVPRKSGPGDQTYLLTITGNDGTATHSVTTVLTITP